MAVIFIGMGYVGTNDGFIMPGLICCIIMACMWLLGDDQDDDSDFGDKIKVPKAVFDYEDKIMRQWRLYLKVLVLQM